MDYEYLEYLSNVSSHYYFTLHNNLSNNYKKSKEILSDLNIAHSIAIGNMHKLIMSKIDNEGKTNESISAKLALIIAFYQGVEVCEESIKNGLYNISAVLLRQELEIIIQISEIDKGIRKDKKVPNISNWDRNFGRIYGWLSELGHLSKKGVLDYHNCEKENSEYLGTSVCPIINEDLCFSLYSMHVYFIVVITECLIFLYKEMYGENKDETQKNIDAIGFVYKVLLDCGALEVKGE